MTVGMNRLVENRPDSSVCVEWNSCQHPIDNNKTKKSSTSFWADQRLQVDSISACRSRFVQILIQTACKLHRSTCYKPVDPVPRCTRLLKLSRIQRQLTIDSILCLLAFVQSNKDHLLVAGFCHFPLSMFSPELKTCFRAWSTWPWPRRLHGPLAGCRAVCAHLNRWASGDEAATSRKRRWTAFGDLLGNSGKGTPRALENCKQKEIVNSRFLALFQQKISLLSFTNVHRKLSKKCHDRTSLCSLLCSSR